MPIDTTGYRKAVENDYLKHQNAFSRNMKIPGTTLSRRKLHTHAALFADLIKIDNSNHGFNTRKKPDAIKLAIPILLAMSQLSLVSALNQNKPSLPRGIATGLALHDNTSVNAFHCPAGGIARNAYHPSTQWGDNTENSRRLTLQTHAMSPTPALTGRGLDNSISNLSDPSPAPNPKIIDADEDNWINTLAGGIEKLRTWVDRYDPLKFPAADAHSTSTPAEGDQYVFNDNTPRNDDGMFKFLTRADIFNRRSLDTYLRAHIRDFTKKGLVSFASFYDEYKKKHPDLPTMAHTLLTAKIKERFNLDIDPDKNYFILFNSATNCRECYTGWRHEGDVVSYETLTSHLYTNFPASAYENKVTLNSECGIYNLDPESATVFDSRNQVRILPSDFVQLIWDLDFYKYAKEKYTEIFADKKALSQKNLIDLTLALATNTLPDTAKSIVMAGVGMIENHNVRVSQFDINGFRASNLFVFQDETSGNVVLYMPYHPEKIHLFSDKQAMRRWIIRNCASLKFVKVLKSHFSYFNQQDGIIYEGISHWLNDLGEDSESDKYIDKLCSDPNTIDPTHFFEKMSELQVDRLLEDLDTLIKSDAEVTRDMWEMDIDALNVFSNPITLLAALALNLEHAIEGDTYEEKAQAWGNVVNDISNLVLMVLIDKMIKLKTYEFKVPETGKAEFYSHFDQTHVEQVLNVLKIPTGDLENSYTISSYLQTDKIRVSKKVLDEVTRLDTVAETDIITLEPDKMGLYYYNHEDFAFPKPAIRIHNKFYPLEPGNAEGAFYLNAENEIILFDNSYYLRNKSPSEIVAYSSCLTKRDGSGSCLHFSTGLEEILDRNIHQGFLPSQMGMLKPHSKYPMFNVDTKGKLFIKYKDVMFSIYERKGLFIVLSKPKSGRFRKFLGRTVVAAIKFSAENGRYFLNTPAENAIETLRCSKEAAALYHFSVEKLIRPDLISANELQSINYYSNDGSGLINNYLIGTLGDNAVGAEVIQSLKRDIDNIHALLHRLGSYTGTVYRGGTLSPDELSYLQPGALMKSKRLLSTSVDRSIAEKHASHKGVNRAMFIIKTHKAGHPIGIYTSRIPEAEVLIEDNTLFRCVAVNGKTIELEEVDDPAAINADQVRVINT